jgi:hypothetical protein
MIVSAGLRLFAKWSGKRLFRYAPPRPEPLLEIVSIATALSPKMAAGFGGHSFDLLQSS